MEEEREGREIGVERERERKRDVPLIEHMHISVAVLYLMITECTLIDLHPPPPPPPTGSNTAGPSHQLSHDRSSKKTSPPVSHPARNTHPDQKCPHTQFNRIWNSAGGVFGGSTTQGPPAERSHGGQRWFPPETKFV